MIQDAIIRGVITMEFGTSTIVKIQTGVQETRVLFITVFILDLHK